MEKGKEKARFYYENRAFVVLVGIPVIPWWCPEPGSNRYAVTGTGF